MLTKAQQPRSREHERPTLPGRETVTFGSSNVSLYQAARFVNLTAHQRHHPHNTGLDRDQQHLLSSPAESSDLSKRQITSGMMNKFCLV
jgi:hypothetical protein